VPRQASIARGPDGKVLGGRLGMHCLVVLQVKEIVHAQVAFGARGEALVLDF
jgi:hypothetical protein